MSLIYEVVLEWLKDHENFELSYYRPCYGDDNDQDEEWRVHSVNGGINDREWTLVGRGLTPLAALWNAKKNIS